MNVFVFIANAWGPVSGGINSFNYDLAIACACAAKKNKNINICCVVPDLSDESIRSIKDKGIIPITLSKNVFNSPEAVQLIYDKMRKKNLLRHYYPERCNTFYIGHDIYTGELSMQLADNYNGWNIVFHHMDYTSYYLFKNQNVSSYIKKTQMQEKVLCNADLVCAVGPLLTESAQDIVRSNPNVETIEVFPGLAEFNAIEKPANRFSPVVFGRVEQDNLRVKQTALAIDAFAKAIEMDKITPVMGNNLTLKVIGYQNEDQAALEAEVKRLQNNARKIAGELCNIVPLPYLTDRKQLNNYISSASVALMLSFHEGFGLVGYEAIAAGVPLILSKNTGLYHFLKREQLDHLVCLVDIKGSTGRKGYSNEDLYNVARILRDIQQNERQRKISALELRDRLWSNRERYSWQAVANSFMHEVLKRFETDLENKSTVFYRPDEVTRLSAALKQVPYEAISFDPTIGKRIFTVEGKNASTALTSFLLKKFTEHYATYIYYVQDKTEDNPSYSSFLNDCRSFFGKEQDFNGSEFKYMLGERLNETILILDGFPIEPGPDFNELLSLLNQSNYNFYIFIVFESDSPEPVRIKPYNKKNIPKRQDDVSFTKSFLPALTNEQMLMAKILLFRGKMPYSKKLISYIYNGVNRYYEDNRKPIAFENTTNLEEGLIKAGVIEEYSEFSYQNTKILLSVTEMELKVDKMNHALGISKLGRYYARCFFISKDRDPKLDWGYFSCKCYAFAASMSIEIKNNIKTDYENVLRGMSEKAKYTSQYADYLKALQGFIDLYIEPDNPWLWYNLIHCESICNPKMETLKKANYILETEIPALTGVQYNKNGLQVQFIRLCAELEHEFDVPGSLEKLLDRIDKLPSSCKVGTWWSQCLSTFINLATTQGRFELAKEYLGKYKKAPKSGAPYSRVVVAAMDANLKIAKFYAGGNVELSKVLPKIKVAYNESRDSLKDFRAQGWTLGLWGECQMLLNDPSGEVNIRKSIECRKQSGEKAKDYRSWLRRISVLKLQERTKRLLEEEIIRTGA